MCYYVYLIFILIINLINNEYTGKCDNPVQGNYVFNFLKTDNTLRVFRRELLLGMNLSLMMHTRVYK